MSLLVLENDGGIRPAGRPDACLYCGQKVGQNHLEDCVTIVQDMLYDVLFHEKLVARYTLPEPASWSMETMRFARNEGSWCANNLLDTGSLEVVDKEEWQKLLGGHDGAGCLCFLRLVPKERLGDVRRG